MILIQFYLQLIVISRAVHGYPLTGLQPSCIEGIAKERLNSGKEGYIYKISRHFCWYWKFSGRFGCIVRFRQTAINIGQYDNKTRPHWPFPKKIHAFEVENITKIPDYFQALWINFSYLLDHH